MCPYKDKMCSLVVLGSIAIIYPFGNTLLNSSNCLSSGNDVNGTLPNLAFAFTTEGVAPETTGGNCPTGVLPRLGIIDCLNGLGKSGNISKEVGVSANISCKVSIISSAASIGFGITNC